MPRRLLSLRTTATLCLLAAGLTFAGCSSGSSSGPSLNVSGTYRVNGSSNAGRFTATATVSQSGNDVTGSYNNNRGGAFRLRGSVSGTHIEGQLVGTNNAATCSFEGDFFSDGSVGSGTYSCNDGETGHVTIVHV